MQQLKNHDLTMTLLCADALLGPKSGRGYNKLVQPFLLHIGKIHDVYPIGMEAPCDKTISAEVVTHLVEEDPDVKEDDEPTEVIGYINDKVATLLAWDEQGHDFSGIVDEVCSASTR